MTDKRLVIRQGMREEVIHLAGGKCKQCPETDLSRLCITVQPGIWAGLGLTDRIEQLQWLANHIDYAMVVCVDHLQTYSARNPIAQTHREQVVEAYGGQCSGCGTTENLGITPGRGIPIPRWPGGRKYNSSAKCAMLVRKGFPKGWFLVCQPCYHKGVHLITPSQEPHSLPGRPD